MNNKKIAIFGIFLALMMCLFVYNSQAKLNWPPQLGKAYPDGIEYYDQSGAKVKMSDFKGQVLFIEFVGMNCPACQAFSGANKKDIGSFENNAVQTGLDSIEEYFRQYSGGLKLSDDRIFYIAVLLYDMKLGHPKADDARKWAEHFKFDKSKKQIVIVPIQDLRGNDSYNLIPGFQLVDKKLVLRSDSTGHKPRDNLYSKLLPMVRKLLEE